MKRASFLQSCGVFGLLLGVSSTGCIAKDCETEDGDDAVCLETPVRYDGEREMRAMPYEPGLHVSIDGIYGNIRVTQASGTDVDVSLRPFAYAGKGERVRAEEAMEVKASLEFVRDGDYLVIRSQRTDGKIPLVGMDLEVSLPADFDGGLVVHNRGNGTWNPGNVDVNFVGVAPSVEVTATSLSDCEITGGPEVRYTFARCGGDIAVLDVADTVQLESTGGFGSVFLALASIAPSAEDSSIRAKQGDVQVLFPEAAAFRATAQATAPGTVDLGNLEEICQTAVTAETAKSVTCGDGDGPLYELVSERAGIILSLQ